MGMNQAGHFLSSPQSIIQKAFFLIKYFLVLETSGMFPLWTPSRSRVESIFEVLRISKDVGLRELSRRKNASGNYSRCVAHVRSATLTFYERGVMAPLYSGSRVGNSDKCVLFVSVLLVVESPRGKSKCNAASVKRSLLSRAAAFRRWSTLMVGKHKGVPC